MKKNVIPIYIVVIGFLSYSIEGRAAGDLTGCMAKRADIQQQIDYARAHNNMHRVAGLQEALTENETHCTEVGLLRARQNKVAEKVRKVAERDQEVRDAIETGNAKKIKLKEKKAGQARDELAEAEAELRK
ncbi:DUF1090 domain-containing protein [Salmonella enterica subsp. enterica serovar Lexington]|uniref:DUF1090 domain-containing protein n=1 Tax=Salmonella enterica TaxID=28901 RepID=A0A5Y5T977_SALER|nr:DUF1090 domain-containing protein [Salmonella enterica subsp. enterica serovar Weltevreden]EAC0964207.1 DUF1090 domain-containing protein [Salmonella enterica subsp. enterica serovar Newport]EAM2795157.1 DUF1090 domain-containing protein [Salmonella enterica]EBR9008041.1 DUF1090 domain-containing protein [Salmonella enterica subsp. enterica serovar Richmond]EBU7427038.1 DUF1090 domain-containing protein [Salmonella enterica subsp. enterica serovar Lexington]EBU7738998.1 DUF1090 domain-conta